MIKKEKLAIIRKVYPNAETTTDLVNKLVDFIENSLELDPGMVMFADSICCDDVNSLQYPDRMKELLGPFKMGGLNGYPFAGLTGMGAFLSHVPDDGAVLIYYGPHIGITRSGELGTNVVNAKDWVPEVPMSIQTTADFNTVNPFMNADAIIRKEKFPKRLVMQSVYAKLDNPTKKARRNYQKYLGKMASKSISKNLKGYLAPGYYESNHYVRTGNTIVLIPDEAYMEQFPDDPKTIFPHHLHPQYLKLADLLPETRP